MGFQLSWESGSIIQFRGWKNKDGGLSGGAITAKIVMSWMLRSGRGRKCERILVRRRSKRPPVSYRGSFNFSLAPASTHFSRPPTSCRWCFNFYLPRATTRETTDCKKPGSQSRLRHEFGSLSSYGSACPFLMKTHIAACPALSPTPCTV